MAALIKVLKYDDPTGKEIVHKFPESGAADITWGSQLVVKESQSAIFFREGRALDVFGPGTHTLTTNNVPLLNGIVEKFITGGDTPFNAEVFFVNQKVFTDLKWGTPQPIDLEDAKMGVVSLRAFGVFAIRVENPKLFVNDLVGTKSFYRTEELNEYMKKRITMNLTDLISNAYNSYFEIRKSTEALASALKIRVKEDFDKYGIELKDFIIESIKGSEEDEKTMNAFREAKRLDAVDQDKYMKRQTADAILKMADQKGGGAGGPMQAGLGLGMGMMLPQMMQQAMQPGGGAPQAAPMAPQPAAASAQAMMACPKCQTQVPATAKFCNGCGAQLGFMTCSKCQGQVPVGSKFCLNCGNSMAGVKCPHCQADLPGGSKFCTNCGKSTDQQ
jgi:membrane protease subunit (stomatin/prohibitin family)